MSSVHASQHSMPFIEQSVAGCLEEKIGAHGLDAATFAAALADVWPHVQGLQREHASSSLELLSISDERADIDAATAALKTVSEGATSLVFFGTGGSSLGGQTLAQLGGWNIPGGASMGQRSRPRTRFYDNLDGNTLDRALANLDLATTRFIVTSKSGGTAETLAQMIAALSAVKAAGLEAQIPRLFLAITEPAQPGKTNGLRSLCEDFSIPMLDHPTGIGGRFSCLTIVGLMPAIARGLDAHAVRRGANSVIAGLLTAKSAQDFAPAVGAATAVALNKKRGIRTLVMMAYADRLQRFSAWFVQLWAESLGKGGEGTSPIAAVGPLDQHSQLQLYMDGPREHYVTVVRAATAGVGPKIDADLAHRAGVPSLAGCHIGDIVAAQSRAVPDALRQAGRPVRTLDLAKLDETTLGALLMHFMIETILAGRMLGLDPFDQPAVELAKVLTRDYLAAKS